MKMYPTIQHFINDASDRLQYQSYLCHPDTWQSMDVSNKPEMVTSEILNYSGSFFLPSTELDYYREFVKPNLPWADKHFELERVSGEPINPGETWKEWPWGHSADKFRKEGDQFEHTYAERYWPKYAGFSEEARQYQKTNNSTPILPLHGIRYQYGDLNDVISHLKRHPLSRQAILPIWFPEDTGVIKGQRVPCSISYHFIRRGDALHINYVLRSCDFYRHFRDDIYLTIRLLFWVLEQLQKGDPTNWARVRPGIYSMWITSLHLFQNDRRAIYGPEDRIPGRS